jgi:putative ABC transport system ATP-binding protein
VTSHPSSDSAILRAENLGRVAGTKVLVENANFAIKSAEILAVVGPSGSGKTSLLRLLNRLDEPTSGTVYVEGTDYRTIPPRELRRKVGMVTQRPFLFPGSVQENLEFGPRQRGETVGEDAVDELLVRVGLKGYVTRNVANLSGGEAQRVSIARTLANSPLVLLMDEPTSSLDEASKLGIEMLIREIVSEQGLTCVMVTHDVAQAARMADRALLLEAARIVRAGPVAEVLHA